MAATGQTWRPSPGITRRSLDGRQRLPPKFYGTPDILQGPRLEFVTSSPRYHFETADGGGLSRWRVPPRRRGSGLGVFPAITLLRSARVRHVLAVGRNLASRNMAGL